MTTVWLVQMAVMVVYFLRLLAAADIRLSGLRLLLTALLVASAPSIYYFYQTDWTDYVIAWTLYPVLVFYLRAAILAEARDRFWRTALRLGLLFGFWVINAHPGFIITSVLALAVYVVVAAPPERRVYLCLGTAAALCLAIASARIYELVRELQLFPVTATAIRDSVDISSFVGALVWPLAPYGGRATPVYRVWCRRGSCRRVGTVPTSHGRAPARLRRRLLRVGGIRCHPEYHVEPHPSRNIAVAFS
jgi:hypothetical protein